MISYLHSVNFPFLNGQWLQMYFHLLIHHLDIYFGEISFQCLLSIFQLDCFGSTLMLSLKFFIYPRDKSFVDHVACKYFQVK